LFVIAGEEIMSEFKCLISGERVCKPAGEKDLVFIIGPGNPEFKEDIETVRVVIKGFGLKPEFALLNDSEKGLDAFCGKICSKILRSLFCVVILNDPVALTYTDKDSKEEKAFRSSRPNVYYEYGLAVALRKRIIPIIRKDMVLPFDIQHIDVDIYEHPDDLTKKLKSSILRVLQSSSTERIEKKPDLELFLVDERGDSVNEVTVRPTFTVVKKVKKPAESQLLGFGSNQLWSSLASIAALNEQFTPKKPSEDLVTVRVIICNRGQKKAEGVKVFLYFPPDCELVDKDEFRNFLLHPRSEDKPTEGGLSVSNRDNQVAQAWIDVLGNDLTNIFEEVYVKVKPEESAYTIKARIVQHDYPSKQFQFTLKVKPAFKEKIEYVEEELGDKATK
jgi:hypothetical protein